MFGANNKIAARLRARAKGWCVTTLCAAGLAIVASCAPVTKMPTVDKAEAEAETETQRDLFVRDLVQQYQRLSNVAYPILDRNA